MMSRIDEIIETFQDLDNELRLEILMDYAEKFPSLPEKYQSEDQIANHRVHECQTPVSLWVTIESDKVYIYADVPRESPTVRGFVSVLISSFNGVSPEEVAKAPVDILHRTGLVNTLGMVRMQGLSAIYKQVKDEIQRLYSLNFVKLKNS